MMTNYIGFFPASETGMFIEVWPGRPGKHMYKDKRTGIDERMPGTVVYIPYGVMLLVRGDTVHAGGMHCDTYNNPYGNPRLHLYIKDENLNNGKEKNGNRWRDYDSEDISDDDTPEENAVRIRPLYDESRKNADCLGYKQNLNQEHKNQRQVFLSKSLFSEMKGIDYPHQVKTGWVARAAETRDGKRKTDIVEDERKPAAKGPRRGGGPGN
jgi:hypothetical protein